MNPRAILGILVLVALTAGGCRLSQGIQTDDAGPVRMHDGYQLSCGSLDAATCERRADAIATGYETAHPSLRTFSITLDAVDPARPDRPDYVYCWERRQPWTFLVPLAGRLSAGCTRAAGEKAERY